MKRKRSPTPKAEKVSPCGTLKTDVDQLIEGRLQEKRKVLREELRKKLIIIRERTTSGVNKPFPEGTFERLKSNYILGNVLEYLTDQNDVMNTYSTCRTFADMMEERRMPMTFPKVLDVFKKKVDDGYELGGKEFGNACYLNWNTFCLNARITCKAWKKSVDFHSDIARAEWVLTTDWADADNFRTNVIILDDEESVERTSSSLIRHGVTLAPTHDLFVVVRDNTSEPYFRKLLEYFKAHGSSVRFMCFHYDSPGNIATGAYGKLCDVLKYMKNLKILNVTFHDVADDDHDNETPELRQADQDQGLYQQQISLPDLSSLEYLLCYDWKLHESMISQILRKCVNLKSVNLYKNVPTEDETVDALVGLNLEWVEGLPTIITSEHFNFTWPLKRLEIFPMGEKIVFNASILFPALNRFRGTLETLYIWDLVKMDEDSRNVRLELLKLKAFSIIDVRHGRLGFDDVLPLKSLEKIIVKYVRYENENAVVKVKRYFDAGEMQKSNVWHCFPNLMRFQIHFGCTYQRPTLHHNQ